MFFPEDSLKRGGRFYLCWVADSWPLRFATITHRQLWSHDIRKICDDLLEVITNESGRPAKRFSLRLSSQLLRGLVRLYQRKVVVLLGDLCMINATVIKNANKKWISHESATENVQRPKLRIIIQEEPENDPRVEELIQNSNNLVANVEDITLKEPTMPENQLLVNDGFGELRIDQHTGDRTIEMMMQADTSAIQHSALELPADISADKSHDKSRLAPHDVAQMEMISEHDISMFRKSLETKPVPDGDFEREIPEIPEIPPPDLNAPHPVVYAVDVPYIQDPVPIDVQIDGTKRKVIEDITLEELEDLEPQAKRRRNRRGLVVDKKTKLSTEYLRARIDNITVELRCEDSADDVVNIRVPADSYWRRPAHAGEKIRSNITQVFSLLFLRNLSFTNRTPMADREMEEAVTKPTGQSHTVSRLERIEEETEQSHEVPQLEVHMHTDGNISNGPNVPEAGLYRSQIDITELPTQVVETLSPRTRKRAGETELAAKRRRTMGYTSYRLSQQLLLEAAVPAYEAEKENITQNSQMAANENERSVTAMLQEAGLADMQTYRPPEVEPLTEASQRKSGRKLGSDTSETPLGSLDRTKVSLGDSDKTTDSKRFIRDQWGTEGTMIKILNGVRDGMKPLDIINLVTKGPIIPGLKAIITARCFTSVLKLKQHGFIHVCKDPQTLEIRDINLGPKFDEQFK